MASKPITSEQLKALAAKLKDQVKKPKPRVPEFEEEKKSKSDDAMDHRAFRKGGFSKAEKREYARQKAVEDLLLPPKNPLPEWLNDPSLLPKRPPGVDSDE